MNKEEQHMKINAYYEILEKVLKERMSKNSAFLDKKKDATSTNFIDKAFDARDKKDALTENTNLNQVSRIIYDVKNEVSNIGSKSGDIENVANFIAGLPRLDDRGNFNDSLVSAFKKDYSKIRSSISKKVDNSLADARRLLGRFADHKVYYGGAGSEPRIRTVFPDSRIESVGSITNNLFDLFSKNLYRYQTVSSGKQDLEVSSVEIRRIEEYEKLFNEGKIEVKTRRTFFVKENPRTIIEQAKKAAVDFARAESIIFRLQSVELPKEFEYTKAEIARVIAIFQVEARKARQTLEDFNMEERQKDVDTVMEEERIKNEEEMRKQQLIRLGYELEQAMKKGNTELVEQITSQIRLIPYNEDDKIFLINEGKNKYHIEEQAKKATIDAIREEMQQTEQMTREATQALYQQAREELEREGLLDDYYVEDGLDVRNTMSNERVHKLIVERMEQIKLREQNPTASMTTEELTFEYLKAIGRIPESATMEQAKKTQDFYQIKATIHDKEEMAHEIAQIRDEKEKLAQRAYKLFKIERSQYESLSAVRREQLLRCAEMLNQLTEDEVKEKYEYQRALYDIYEEIGVNEDLSNSGGGMRL